MDQIKEKKPSWIWLYGILLFSLVGMLDSGFLTYKHYTGGSLSCSLLNGCDLVTTSRYSTILGTPISLFGLIFYVIIFVTSLMVLERQKYRLLPMMIILSAGALAFSGYLIYLQAFVLHAFCLYCLGSAISSLFIFVFLNLFERKILKI